MAYFSEDLMDRCVCACASACVVKPKEVNSAGENRKQVEIVPATFLQEFHYQMIKKTLAGVFHLCVCVRACVKRLQAE